MNTRLKIQSDLLDQIREDLERPHAFAAERVGFITAGVTWVGEGLMLLARSYHPVADEDYVEDPSAGATIGGDAMRKALEAAYTPRSVLLHLHSHGGRGRPDFSGIDLRSGAKFVPGFFHAVSRMPHGMLVLSNDSATGKLWLSGEDRGSYINEFVGIGAPIKKFGRHL
jgi:proteasome lid subunit RPN8/RPN11